MDEMDEIIEKLSLEECKIWRERLKAQCKVLKKQRAIEEIKQTVAEMGCKLSHQFYKIPELHYFTLDLYVDLKTCGFTTDPEDNFKIVDLHEVQDPWYDELGDDVCPENADLVLPCNDSWQASNFDEPVRGKGTVDVYLYYRKMDCPPDGTEFVAFCSAGEKYDLEVRGDRVLVKTNPSGEKDLFCLVNEWSTQDLAALVELDDD